MGNSVLLTGLNGKRLTSGAKRCENVLLNRKRGEFKIVDKMDSKKKKKL